MDIWNVDILPQHYTASQPRRPQHHRRESLKTRKIQEFWNYKNDWNFFMVKLIPENIKQNPRANWSHVFSSNSHKTNFIVPDVY
jgi:hypothetical protein